MPFYVYDMRIFIQIIRQAPIPTADLENKYLADAMIIYMYLVSFENTNEKSW